MSLIRVLVLGGLAMLSGCAAVPRPTSAAARATVAIRDVSVIDVEAGAVQPHRTVLVEGERIVAVGPSDTTPLPTGARVIEGGGRFLIPGLWDMHTHALWSLDALETFLPLYVSQGVTGIRDMGGSLAVLAAARDALARGQAPFPRVVGAGVILDGAEPVHPEASLAVPDAASAHTAVATVAAAGADFVKVYTLLSRDAYLAVVEEAQRRGLPVAGHVPASVTPEEAARAGQVSFEHLRDELDPLFGPKEAEGGRRLAALFRDRGTWQVPTLVTLHMKAHADDPALASDARLRYVLPELRRDWLAYRERRLGRGAAYFERRRQRYQEEEWLVRFLDQERVPILAGSDAGEPFCLPGFGLHDELERLVAAGLSPAAALRAATVGPATFLAQPGVTGAISPGQPANLVLLRANPLVEIAATRQIEAVVLRGRTLPRAELDALLEAVAARVAGRSRSARGVVPPP